MSTNVFMRSDERVRSDGDFTQSMNPTTGENIGRYALNTPKDVKEAVEKSRKAQKIWAELPVKERARAVLKIRNYIVDNAEGLSQIIYMDNGKTPTEAMVAEVFGVVAHFDYLAKNAKRLLKDYTLKPANLLLAYKRSTIIRIPYGVIGIISPWNYPFNIPMVEIAMALMAGNGIVLKVASETLAIGKAIEMCIKAGDLPDGLFQYVNLPGRIAGDAFFDAGIDKLFFTGSVGVGKRLMAKAAETLTPVSLELGGNDPMLVCPDVDVYRAASGAVWAGLTNCGQTCASVERIYVHRDVYEPFVKTLSEMVNSLKVGPGEDYSSDICTMTTKKQMEVVEKHLEDAVEKGAVIAAKTNCPENTDGNFLSAVVLTNVNHDMMVMCEETFGPILPVMKVNDMEEAIALANDSDLGLTASVWSKSRKKAKAIARRIETGVVMINDHLTSNGLPETPWGGFKESGIGRTHGELGFAEMTQPLCIVNDLLPGAKRNMWCFPQGKIVYDGILGMMHMLYSKNIIKRLVGSLKLNKLFLRTFTRKD